ncbi:MAG TPA: acyltransferase [Baekduia sp.]|uniref:acyltransferase family protein n=1 Tax=Baekduia sp. TaxID=2600305 RepID=UPI002D7740A3|nr:acyltransferase [Baekduia sp.]HET6507536.1 acyltransferase [Baekduia sp.]
MPTAEPATAAAPRASRPSAEAKPASGGGRLDALDGLRGLAALGVLVLHVWMFSYGDDGKPPKGFLDFSLGELRLGVQLFFVLSGFLIFRPFAAAILDGAGKGPNLKRYMIRRAARILPGYWLALGASFLLLKHLDHPMQVDPAQLPVFLVFAENHFLETIKHLDPPMWTLAIEVSFYATLPVFGLLALKAVGGLRSGRRAALAALTLLVVAGGVLATILAYTHRWPETLSTSLLPHLVEFGAGMTAAVLLHGRGMLDRRAAGGLVLLGLALVVANSWWHATGQSTKEVRSWVGDAPGIAGLAIVLAVLVAGPWRARLLSRGPAKWLGAISYGVYLIHFPVIVFLRMTERWPEDSLGQELLKVMAITIPLATLSWLCVERPAIRWARRTTARPRTRREPHRQRTGERPALRPRPAEGYSR